MNKLICKNLSKSFVINNEGLDVLKDINLEINESERFQDLKQSIEIDDLCKAKLEEHNLPYHEIEVDNNTVKSIIKLLF